ncbi:MAG: hypothetical protein HWE16_01585 [Gammaproteobacteria bacterium]|nr:hypothetical protein [Gammaproteobacteria bacterium]
MKKLGVLLPITIVTVLLSLNLAAKETNGSIDKFDYFFNQILEFDNTTHTPSGTLGYAIGDWHIRPDQSYAYFKALAESSAKVELQVTGHSHEQRPLIAAFISSPENLAKLSDIQANRKNLKFADVPNVIYLGYSVHGNEASGANAAPLVAYRLAASKESWIQNLLQHNIVIIDPMLNPDGLDRFANWVNRYKGAELVSDPDSMELNEAWPAGRTNHYWFDLNRDWLLLQHPESRARVKLFYDWRPNIVGDFHEMGTNATYFFQPGVPSRQNPLTSDENFELTNEIAKYHAKALDDLGVAYYSKESFDDFYYGKGSTFPDINGGIGILFEQASARGHLQESVNGELSFPFAVRNQVATSFSTLKAANELNQSLKQYQQDFFSQQKAEASRDTQQGIVFSSNDAGRLQEFLSILNQHQISVEQLKSDAVFDKNKYSASNSYLVKSSQAQYGLIKAIFETRTKFEDNTFYDVSAWTMPLAFNLQYQFLDPRPLASLSTKTVVTQQGQLLDIENPVAFAFSPDNFYSLGFANKLLQKGIKVQLANKAFSLPVSQNEKQFQPGTLVVPIKNSQDKDAVKALWQDYAQDKGIDLFALGTGFARSGIDLGSPSINHLKQPKPLLLIGDGVSSYEAGEAWHLLDKRLQIPVSMQYAKDLTKIDLAKYSHLIMVNGRYPKLDDSDKEKLESWIQSGGNLIASRSAVKWLIEQKLVPIELAEKEKQVATQRPFNQRGQAFAEELIGGAILKTQLDLTHPLTYGLDLSSLPVTKAGRQVLKPAEQDFITVATYAAEPLMAGYASQSNIDAIKNSPAVLAISKGQGSIVMFNDNPNFRGYWMGSARLFANALFFNGAF